MDGPLLIVATTAADWALLAAAWAGLRRLAGMAPSPRRDALMPWVALQTALLAGLVVTGALSAAPPSAVVLTGVPVAMASAFFALVVAAWRARGGGRWDLRVCLDHALATAVLWGIALLASWAP